MLEDSSDMTSYNNHSEILEEEESMGVKKNLKKDNHDSNHSFIDSENFLTPRGLHGSMMSIQPKLGTGTPQINSKRVVT